VGGGSGGCGDGGSGQVVAVDSETSCEKAWLMAMVAARVVAQRKGKDKKNKDILRN